MNERTPLRRLPASTDGHMAFSDDIPEGRVARTADAMEDQQMDSAEFVLNTARKMRGMTRPLSVPEYPYVVAELCACLENVLRIAESRGERLDAWIAQDEEEQEPENPDGPGD